MLLVHRLHHITVQLFCPVDDFWMKSKNAGSHYVILHSKSLALLSINFLHPIRVPGGDGVVFDYIVRPLDSSW